MNISLIRLYRSPLVSPIKVWKNSTGIPSTPGALLAGRPLIALISSYSVGVLRRISPCSAAETVSSDLVITFYDVIL
uniref:Uncharacterized protein n=1 Tax=Physcomitrium patens TaxID=3218 RepID=A0A2K1LBQ8_PHYPA|nr:hypothetical protein PHYPA_001890 [Physcomitrium patens]